MRKQEKKWRIFFDAASEIFNKFSSNWNFININWNFNIRLELVSEIFVFTLLTLLWIFIYFSNISKLWRILINILVVLKNLFET